jgi:hypothetical protein
MPSGARADSAVRTGTERGRTSRCAGSSRSSLRVPRSNRSLTVSRTGPKVKLPRRRASIWRCRTTRSNHRSDHALRRTALPGRSLAPSRYPFTRRVSVTWSSTTTSGTGRSFWFQISTSSATSSPQTARSVPSRRSKAILAIPYRDHRVVSQRDRIVRPPMRSSPGAPSAAPSAMSATPRSSHPPTARSPTPSPRRRRR